jgi:hypothetical protein
MNQMLKTRVDKEYRISIRAEYKKDLPEKEDAKGPKKRPEDKYYVDFSLVLFVDGEENKEALVLYEVKASESSLASTARDQGTLTSENRELEGEPLNLLGPSSLSIGSTRGCRSIFQPLWWVLRPTSQMSAGLFPKYASEYLCVGNLSMTSYQYVSYVIKSKACYIVLSDGKDHYGLILGRRASWKSGKETGIAELYGSADSQDDKHLRSVEHVCKFWKSTNEPAKDWKGGWSPRQITAYFCFLACIDYSALPKVAH